MTTRERLHRLVDALPASELDTAARVLEALAGAPSPRPARPDQGERGDAAERVLSIGDACALLGLRSRATFYRDPVWPTLVDRPSPGRVGIRLSVVLAELDRRRARGDTTTPCPLRAPSARAASVPDDTPARPYVRRRRAGRLG